MAKRFGLRFSKVIPSFLLCRSKHPNRLHINPTPLSVYRRKSLDISCPCLPNPPPSTPISFSGVAEEVDSGGDQSSNDADVSSTSPFMAKKRVAKRKGGSSNVVFRSRVSSSSGDSGWFSSDADEDYIPSEPTKSRRPSKPKRKAAILSDKASTFRMKTGMQSVAVEKRSNDPLRDFKSSMMEMIVEKEMVEVKDLEDLLQCFLTLNSRRHHQVIVEAFTEIWEAMFAKSPLNRCRLVAKKKDDETM